MKASLDFDLTDPDQRQEHLRCVKSLDMAILLHEFSEYLRNRIKNMPDTATDEEYKLLDAIHYDYFEMLQDNGINLEELLS